MDSDSITMETDDDESSMDEEEEFEPKQEVWVQSSSDAKSYKPVHLNISYEMGAEGQVGNESQSKKNKGNDPTALAILRRLSPELQQGYRILIDLMGDRCKSFAWPFMDRVDPVALHLPDYYDRIKTPMWLTRIEEKFEKVEYTSITEFVADIRQIFENCYRYNGLKHMVSRQAQVMECHFEQKLTQLSRHIRDKTHFRWSSDQQTPEQDTAMSSTFGRRVSQRILESRTTMTPVADAMQRVLEREDEERRKQRIIERKAELERLNQRLVEWEKEELLVEPLNTQLKSMWEIPALGQFLKLCRENMFLPEFSIFELERALVLPQSSKLLARIFTNVLTTRYNRKRVSKKPPMPYEFWQDKLRKKLDIWYAFLAVESATRQSVARHLYISERFFEVLGDGNPLTGRQYHDLAIYERVWILKGMCDHLFETDYDVWFGVDTSVVEDQRAVVLGEDDGKCSYLYFPHFLDTDLRIYRQAQIKEDKPKKKKAEKAEKSPRKKSNKEDEKTGTPSQNNEGPKKRGRPRKNPEDENSSPVKTGKTPARTGKMPAKANKTPATPVSEGPKKRGRPRKNPETESESEPASTSKETVAGTETPAQPTPGARSGRGRPRKDGTTPSQALKKTPAKPTAVVTPTRRSSRRAARLEKTEQEEQEGEMEEEQKEGSVEDRTDKVCSPRLPGADGESLEQKDLNCERTVSADGVSDGSVGTTHTQPEAGVGTSENKHLEMTSAENTEASFDGLPGEDDGRTSTSIMSQEGVSQSDVKEDSPSDLKDESPSKHVLCNGVMDVDEKDNKIPIHSIDSKDDETALSKSELDQISSEEEITNANHIQVASSDKLQNSSDPISLKDKQQIENSITSNDTSTLNQNQSNNVMDIDDKIAQLPVDMAVGGKDLSDNIIDTGHEVVADVPSDNSMDFGEKAVGEIQCNNVKDTGDEVVGEVQSHNDNGEEVDCRDMVNDNLDIDCKDSVYVPDSMDTQGSAPREEITNQGDCPMDEVKDSNQGDCPMDEVKDSNQGDCPMDEVKDSNQGDCPMDEVKDSNDVSTQDGHPSQERNTEDAAQRDESVETGTEAELAPKEEAMDLVLQEQMEGDVKPMENVEVIERTPTPTPHTLPGILPPEGEFELVCDSVVAFRQLIEKFAQKEETITKGRKTIVQPIKRSGRTIELHKTLSKMLEDFEPVEAKLQKVIHKAREIVYNESEAYKIDPSPNQEAAAFWYQIHVKKPAPAVESSSVEASSVDDDFSSSESSSELDSDEISDPDSEDDDETAEYDGSDTASVVKGATDELNGSEANPENQGDKVDLYSGVEIAGRTMRSSKRRRAQKREVIRDKKKAKRSKIQIVKGVPLQGRYAQADEDEETDETKLKKVHEELKQNLKAGSTFQMTKHHVPGSTQKNFQPYKKAGLPTSSRESAVKKEPSPAYQRDTSEKFIRILKRTAGTSEPATVAPISKPVKLQQEPTLKVPFLQKSKPTVQPVVDAPTGDKKMKTETFSFTIDAKIWESLKDKPEERQRLIVEHVEKMRVAGGPKKEPPQKVQNSRLSPWFSRNTSPSSTTKSASTAGATDGSSLPQNESAEKRLCSGMDVTPGEVGEKAIPLLKQKEIPEVQEHMPILDPVRSQKGTLLQNTNMPTLAPVVSQKIILGSPGSISMQQACSTLGQTQGLQQGRSGNHSTAIASSSGNNVSTSVPKEQLFILLPNGQLTRRDGTLVETKHSSVTNKSTFSPPQQQQRLVTQVPSAGVPLSTQQYMYVPYQNVGNLLNAAAAGAKGNVVSRTVQAHGSALSLNARTVHPTAATKVSTESPNLQQVQATHLQRHHDRQVVNSPPSTPCTLYIQPPSNQNPLHPACSSSRQLVQTVNVQRQVDPKVVKSPPSTPCTLYILPPSNQNYPAACNSFDHASKHSASQGTAPHNLITILNKPVNTNPKKRRGRKKGTSHAEKLPYKSPITSETKTKNDSNMSIPDGAVMKGAPDTGIIKLPAHSEEKTDEVMLKKTNVRKPVRIAMKSAVVNKKSLSIGAMVIKSQENFQTHQHGNNHGQRCSQGQSSSQSQKISAGLITFKIPVTTKTKNDLNKGMTDGAVIKEGHGKGIVRLPMHTPEKPVVLVRVYKKENVKSTVKKPVRIAKKPVLVEKKPSPDEAKVNKTQEHCQKQQHGNHHDQSCLQGQSSSQVQSTSQVQSCPHGESFSQGKNLSHGHNVSHCQSCSQRQSFSLGLNCSQHQSCSQGQNMLQGQSLQHQSCSQGQNMSIQGQSSQHQSCSQGQNMFTQSQISQRQSCSQDQNMLHVQSSQHQSCSQGQNMSIQGQSSQCQSCLQGQNMSIQGQSSQHQRCSQGQNMSIQGQSSQCQSCSQDQNMLHVQSSQHQSCSQGQNMSIQGQSSQRQSCLQGQNMSIQGQSSQHQRCSQGQNMSIQGQCSQHQSCSQGQNVLQGQNFERHKYLQCQSCSQGQTMLHGHTSWRQSLSRGESMLQDQSHEGQSFSQGQMCFGYHSQVPGSSQVMMPDNPSDEGVFRLLNRYFDELLEDSLGDLYEPASGQSVKETQSIKMSDQDSCLEGQ